MGYKNAGRSQANMLAYAKNNLDPRTAKKVIKANKMSTLGMYIYIVIFFALMFIPISLIGKISNDLMLVLISFAIFSPVIYLGLYYTTFGKKWAQYVKWYTKTDKSEPFAYDEGVEDAQIIDIRGSNTEITITYDNGYVLKADGELTSDRTFSVYKSSVTHWEPPHAQEPFTMNDALKIVEDVKARRSSDKVRVEFVGRFELED